MEYERYSTDGCRGTSDEDEYKTAAMKKARSLVNLPSWSSSENLRKLGNQTGVNSTGWVAPQSWDVDTSTNEQTKLKAKMRAKAKARAKARAKAKAKARAKAESQERLRRVDTTPIDPLTTILSGGVLVVPDSDENEELSPNEPIHFNQNSFGKAAGVENQVVADSDGSSSSESESDRQLPVHQNGYQQHRMSTKIFTTYKIRLVRNIPLMQLTCQIEPFLQWESCHHHLELGRIAPGHQTMKGMTRSSIDLKSTTRTSATWIPSGIYAICIFNTDDTFTTLSCVPNTTVEELIPTLKKKFR